MPNPEKGETEREFLSRCIPHLIKKEGYENRQAVAICYSIYRKEGTEKKSPKPNNRSPKSPRTKRKVAVLSNYF